MLIRHLEHHEIPTAKDLIWNVFLQFEAPDYSEEGIHEFKSYIEDSSSLNRLVFYGAFMEDKMIGIIALLESKHISLFFVDKEYVGHGVGRKLFDYILTKRKGEVLTVNSSPYAVNIYHALGFTDVDSQQEKNGIIYTPMIYRTPLNN